VKLSGCLSQEVVQLQLGSLASWGFHDTCIRFVADGPRIAFLIATHLIQRWLEWTPGAESEQGGLGSLRIVSLFRVFVLGALLADRLRNFEQTPELVLLYVLTSYASHTCLFHIA